MKERLRPTGVVNTGNNVSGNTGLRLGKRYTVLKGKGKKWITKKQIKHGAQFQKYAGPSVKLGRTVGAGVMGAGKLALRNPGIGLVTTGLYYGGKAIGTRAGAKKFKYPNYREFNKKGRKII